MSEYIEKPNVLLIGLGRLGSRHLQGLLRAKNSVHIHCVEPNCENIDRAKLLLEETENLNLLSSVEYYQKIPQNLKFILYINACTAENRYATTLEAFQNNEIKYTILEKVLFNDIKNYGKFKDFVGKKIIFVNCARRVNKSYIYTKSIIDRNKPVSVSVHGGLWGLCCNGVHFLDLFSFLTGDYEFNEHGFKENGKPYPAKRRNYWELNGAYWLRSNMNKFSMVCKDGKEDLVVKIENDKHKFIINETTGSAEYFIEGVLRSEQKFLFEPQSCLTGKYLDDLVDGIDLNLTKYFQSAILHETYLRDLHGVFRETISLDAENLPIT